MGLQVMCGLILIHVAPDSSFAPFFCDKYYDVSISRTLADDKWNVFQISYLIFEGANKKTFGNVCTTHIEINTHLSL